MKQSVSRLVESIDSMHGKGSIMVLGSHDLPEERGQVISTGSEALNTALGIGGYPKGRIVELFGPEGCGSSALALQAVAEAQKAGGVVAIIDTEHAFDAAAAVALGIDTEKLLVSQPDSAEQALEIIEMLAKSGAVDLVVVDSVSAMTPRAALDYADALDEHIGLMARLMSQGLRVLAGAAHRTGTTILVLNRLLPLRGFPTSTAGNALKFYASVRLDVRSDGPKMTVKVIKNKCAVPFKSAELTRGEDGRFS